MAALSASPAPKAYLNSPSTAVQFVHCDCPTSFVKEPAGQGGQKVDPGSGWYSPLLQGVGAPCCAPAVKKPGSETLHLVGPTDAPAGRLLKFPAWQGKHWGVARSEAKNPESQARQISCPGKG